MNGVPDLFRKLIHALEPWLDQLVIIGGWAHRLYREHPSAQELDYPPLMTLDTDIAVPARLPAREADIRSRLLDQGFAEEFLGDDRPPATHYHLGGGEQGFYAEFLSPLTGAGYGRQGRRKATAEIAGVATQQLRHVDILLVQPWLIALGTEGFQGQIRIANPVSFLAQKILIHGSRARNGRAKDILYMHDTLEVFGARLPELVALWNGAVGRALLPRNARIVSNASRALFGRLTDDIRRAAEIAGQRGLPAEAIREACQYGFGQVFS